MKNTFFSKSLMGVLLIVLGNQAQARHDYFIDISSDTYQYRDMFRVRSNDRVKKLRPWELEKISFNGDTEVCYLPFRHSNTVKLSILQKNSLTLNSFSLKSKGCKRINNKHWISNFSVFILLNAQKLMVKPGGYKGIYTKGTTEAENVNNTESQTFATCLAGNDAQQLIQPTTYQKFVVPFNSEYNGEEVELVYITNTTVKTIKKTKINNNLANFGKVTFKEDKYYLKLSKKDKVLQTTFVPWDIETERKDTQSIIIPQLISEDKASLSQNHVKYDLELFANKQDRYSYLYTYAINDMLSKAKGLGVQESVAQFVNDYLNHYCKPSNQMDVES